MLVPQGHVKGPGGTWDLVAEMGEPYLAYRRRVPMLIPWRRPADESVARPTG
jgi:hypothetical protein